MGRKADPKTADFQTTITIKQSLKNRIYLNTNNVDYSTFLSIVLDFYFNHKRIWKCECGMRFDSHAELELHVLDKEFDTCLEPEKLEMMKEGTILKEVIDEN